MPQQRPRNDCRCQSSRIRETTKGEHNFGTASELWRSTCSVARSIHLDASKELGTTRTARWIWSDRLTSGIRQACYECPRPPGRWDATCVKQYGGMASRPAVASPLSHSERELIELLLPREYPDDGSLRVQLDVVLAYPSCNCGCGSIGFQHAGGLRPGPSGLNRQATGSASPVVIDDDGNDVGGLILFTRQGLLDDLEVYSYGPEPLPLPDARHVRFPPPEPTPTLG